MSEYSDYFNTRALNEQHRKLELDDLNHAIAGVDVGRMRKHIPGTAIDPVTGKKESVADRIARTLRWLLLNDENYARAHRAAVTATNDAMNAAAQALSDINTDLMQTTADIDDILNRAATLPDGRKVFRDVNGKVVDQDGNVIAQALADGIMWRGDEPKYDEYRAATDHLDDLKRARDELLGIETELGGYQDELNDDENPVSPVMLDDITKRSDDLRDRINEIEQSLAHNAPEQTRPTEPTSEFRVESDGSDLTKSLSISLGTKP